MSLTQYDADLLFSDFKRYRDSTDEICIIGPKKFDRDPSGRHYEIVYPEQHKGLSWKIRFSNYGFLVNGLFMPCSIKAIINPKVLIGEKSYIVAADAGYLENVERIFNQEAEKISYRLKRFDDYSLSRLDYCINFDVSELKFDYLPELSRKLPELIMELIKYGDIPDHFSEEYKDTFQFYLKSKSVVINCYWKHDDLRRNFPDCQDLKNSYNIIRFEVQFKYPKIYTASAGIRKQNEVLRSIRGEKLMSQIVWDFDEDEGNEDGYYTNRPKSGLSYETAQSDFDETRIMKGMLSDEKCADTIDYYFYKVIKPGDYYTFDAAKRIIERKINKWEKVVRLTDALKIISDYGGISKVKAVLQDNRLEDFRRSLRDLANLRINPVTIPKEWGIEYIPNLLDNYYAMLAEERAKIQEEEFNKELLDEYFKDRKKKSGRK